MEISVEKKTIIIRILDEFVRVCNDNGLKYYLGYGTALGAVRHNGMIPWDDDVDVIMPRQDYNRLLKIGNTVLKDGYRLAHYSMTEGYYYDIAKIEDINTTLIERIDPLYIGGVYIDVFPMDNVPSPIEAKFMLRKVNKIMNGYARYYMYPLPKKFFLKWMIYRIGRANYPILKKLNIWDKITSAYVDQDTVYIHDFHCYMNKGLFNMKVFGEGTEMTFEGKKYIIPAQYDAYLRQYYGDYMTPPPIECRNSGHHYLYENLSKRLSEEELQPIVKQLRIEHTYQFGIKREYRMICGKIKEWIGK